MVRIANILPLHDQASHFCSHCEHPYPPRSSSSLLFALRTMIGLRPCTKILVATHIVFALRTSLDPLPLQKHSQSATICSHCEHPETARTSLRRSSQKVNMFALRTSRHCQCVPPQLIHKRLMCSHCEHPTCSRSSQKEHLSSLLKWLVRIANILYPHLTITRTSTRSEHSSESF